MRSSSCPWAAVVAPRSSARILVAALEYAESVGATLTGIVGRDGGVAAHLAEACVIVPVVNPSAVTPHTEAFQAVIWHLLVSHPALRTSPAKWESTAG